MKKRPSLVQYTVGGVPREVEIALRRKAAKHKVSLNQLILEELSHTAPSAQAHAVQQQQGQPDHGNRAEAKIEAEPAQTFGR